MSFWDKLSTIFTVAGKIIPVAGKMVPVVSLINPAAGLILGTVVSTIVGVEQQFPSGTGVEKKAVVTGVANTVAAAHGLSLDPDQLSKLIDSTVAMLNKTK